MAEQIDIATLNWDTDKLAKNLLDVRVQIDEFKNSLKDNRKEMRENVKESKELEKAQENLVKSGQKEGKEYEDNAKKLKQLEAQRVSLTKSMLSEEQQVKNLNKQQRDLKTIIDATSKSQIDNSAIVEQATSLLDANWKSQEQARSIGKSLITLRKQLNPEIEEEAELMQKLTERINEANDYQKQYQTENEKRISGIGLYEDAINKAMEGTKGFGGAVGSTIPNVKGLISSVRAFMAIPLVAVISLIVTGITLMVKQFAATEKGMDAITSVTRPLMAILQSLGRIIGELAGDLFDAFKDPQQAINDFGRLIKENVINRLTAFKVIAEGIINLDWRKIVDGIAQGATGVENMTSKMKDFGDAIQDAADKGKQLDETIKAREKLEENIAKSQSESNLRIQEITQQMRDGNLSWSERVKLANERLKVQEDIARQQKDIIDLELQEARINQEINGETQKSRKEINELIAKQIDLDTQTQALRVRNQRYISQAAKEEQDLAEERHQAALDRALQDKNIALERFKLLNEGRQNDLNEELKYQKQLSDQRLAILDQEYENGKKSKEEYELEKQKIAVEAAQKEAELIVSYSEEELNRQIINLEKLQEERGRITDESVEEEKRRIDAIEALERENLERSVEAGLISRREYNNSIVELEQQKNERLDEVNRAYEEQRKQDEDLARLLENENRLLQIQDRFDRETELENQLNDEKINNLEAQREQGKISEENYLKSIEVLNQKHADVLERIDAKRNAAKVRMAQQTFASMADVFGQETTTGKFFASAQAVIDTYAAANLALSTYPPPFSYIAMATAIATGLKNVSEINKTKTDFYTGGYTGDGGIFSKRGNVHAGEVVFNQADVMRLGGPNVVDAMRPTSENFNMPNGIGALSDPDQWNWIAQILGENVRAGANEGTNKGIVQANEDNEVMRKAIF